MGIYDRNRLYVSAEEQGLMKHASILLAGADLGSNVAECALRFGFENMTIVDGSRVDETDLNRQNFVRSDVGKYKAETLCKRLLKINPGANISFRNERISRENVAETVRGHRIAVNTLPYDSDLPFLFDRLCSERGIPVLHPWNFGWAGFLTVVKPGGYQLTEISEGYQGFELKLAAFVACYCTFWNIGHEWIADVVRRCQQEQDSSSLPQLSIAAWIAAGQCVTAMYNITTNKKLLYFPKFYLSTIVGEKQ